MQGQLKNTQSCLLTSSTPVFSPLAGKKNSLKFLELPARIVGQASPGGRGIEGWCCFSFSQLFEKREGIVNSGVLWGESEGALAGLRSARRDKALAAPSRRVMNIGPTEDG